MDAPRWDLTDIYPSLQSENFAADLAALKEAIAQMKRSIASCAPTRAWCEQVLADYEHMSGLALDLANYAQICYTVETQNPEILAALASVEALDPELNSVGVLLANAFASIEGDLDRLKAESPLIAAHSYIIEKLILDTKYRMSLQEEALAADLGRSGANAWSRLQETLIAGTSIAWGEADETPSYGEPKTINELRAMAMDADRETRARALRHEIALLKRHEASYAAALNGVKGSVLSLEKHRQIPSYLFNSIRASELNEDILKVLIETLEDARDLMGRYFRKKAERLGIAKMDFYDLFAPVWSPLPAGEEPKEEKVWSTQEACDYVVKLFASFHKPMGDFAKMAFEKNWVDFPIQKGKVGGAFCMSFPRQKQSRVLLNFDGTFGSVATLAHEMGHAYHDWAAQDVPVLLQQDTPMTLAETASIFAETIVSGEAMREAAPEEKVMLLDQTLQSSSQVIIDILSRYYFECSVFERRSEGELSAEDFCALMADAQRRAYGDSLGALHPYMWAVKGHYYIPDLSFYNYPYAFGLLFGLGLYEISREQRENFGALYDDILAHTGAMSAADVAKRAGLDISKKEFWMASLRQLEEQIKEFEELV